MGYQYFKPRGIGLTASEKRAERISQDLTPALLAIRTRLLVRDIMARDGCCLNTAHRAVGMARARERDRHA